jgi:hypothetical protein
VKTFLWRLDGAIEQPQPDAWKEGLTLHLLFQSLSTIIVRRDGQIRHYLGLQGCPSCRPDGCERMCHRMLFAQLVRTALPGVVLTPVARLSPRATETRHLLAVPQRPAAELLDATFLAQWSEGHLVTTWSQLRAASRPISVGARLAVGTSGPDPAAALRKAGWRPLALATMFRHRQRKTDVPAPVHVDARASESLLVAFRDPCSLLPTVLAPVEEP